MSTIDDVRADLEDRPRGPFTVDPGAALDALEVSGYGENATLGHDGTWFWAWQDGSSEEAVAAATPDELVTAMRVRWGR